MCINFLEAPSINPSVGDTFGPHLPDRFPPKHPPPAWFPDWSGIVHHPHCFLLGVDTSEHVQQVVNGHGQQPRLLQKAMHGWILGLGTPVSSPIWNQHCSLKLVSRGYSALTEMLEAKKQMAPNEARLCDTRQTPVGIGDPWSVDLPAYLPWWPMLVQLTLPNSNFNHFIPLIAWAENSWVDVLTCLTLVSPVYRSRRPHLGWNPQLNTYQVVFWFAGIITASLWKETVQAASKRRSVAAPLHRSFKQRHWQPNMTVSPSNMNSITAVINLVTIVLTIRILAVILAVIFDLLVSHKSGQSAQALAHAVLFRFDLKLVLKCLGTLQLHPTSGSDVSGPGLFVCFPALSVWGLWFRWQAEICHANTWNGNRKRRSY